MELENIIFSEVTKFRKSKVPCFLSYVEYRPNTNTSVIHTHTQTQIYIQICKEHVPRVGQVEETKVGRKEGKLANNNEIHHIFVGPRHNKT
jgi:hypothetical protein